MHDTPQATSAIDAIRCFYLAHLVEQKGYPEAAQRWQNMATRWLNHLEPNTAQRRPSPADAD